MRFARAREMNVRTYYMYVRSSRCGCSQRFRELSQHSLLDSARDDVGDQEFSGVVIYAEVSCSRNDAIDLSKRKKNRSQS